MTLEYNEDIEAIRKWLKNEEYLPNFNDLMLQKFLHSCYGSIEKSKKCIDKFCTLRSEMDEIMTKRDLSSPAMKTVFSIIKTATFKTPSNQEILIYQIDDPNLEKFVFYDVLKAFSILGECWMNENDVLPEEHIVILDMNCITLKIVPKVNLMFLKKFFTYLLEATPVRLKQLHMINCPSVIDKLFALVKPMLPAEICKLFKFHTGVDGLYKYIERKSLPIEYGGEGQTIQEQNKQWLQKAEKNKDIYISDALWTSDLKKKPKNTNSTSFMEGSFKKLDID